MTALALAGKAGGAARAGLPALVAVLLAPILLVGGPATSTAAGGTPPGVALSDGRTHARWAHPQEVAGIRSAPARSARLVGRLHFLTEDGYPEVYQARRRAIDVRGNAWIQVGIPRRPNGSTGWVRQESLGPLYRVRTRLTIDRSARRAVLYRAGRRIWSSRIGVGAPSTPTPRGNFWIREKFKVAKSGGIYGPRAFGTSGYSRLTDWPGGGVIGIHGTNQPELIPGNPSHGCVRVPNAAIIELYGLLPIGTPVEIR